MIYILTDREIKCYETLEEIDEQEQFLIDKTELHSIGADYIVKLTNKDIDFVRDKHNISRLALEKLYGKVTKTEKEKRKSTLILSILGTSLLVSLFTNAVLLGLAL